MEPTPSFTRDSCAHGSPGSDAGDLELMHRTDTWGVLIGAGSFGYGFVSFMSQILLPDGTLESYPTMVFKMVGDSASERQAVERTFDYMGSRMWHFTGDLEAFRNIFAPYTVTPSFPQLGWVIYVAEAGSPSMSGTLTGTFRAVSLKAKQFLSSEKKLRPVPWKPMD